MQSINLLFYVLKNCFCTSIHLQKRNHTPSKAHNTSTIKNKQVKVLWIRLTVDPQSPSPTLPSHSFRLSLSCIIAFAAASMATSRIWPCSFRCCG